VVVSASATQRDGAASSARVFTARGRVKREIGTATVVITPNAAVAAMADSVIRLADGRVVSVETHARKAGARELQW
jgi:putative ABC transport system ATP-binding protein